MAALRPPQLPGLPSLGGRQCWRDLVLRHGSRVQSPIHGGPCRLLDTRDRIRHRGTFAACRQALEALPAAAPAPSSLLLLHGLARSRHSLHRLAGTLDEYNLLDIGYASCFASLPELVDDVLACLQRSTCHLPANSPIDILTHSMGGIIARALLTHPAWPQQLTPRRLLMLFPPNQGSQLSLRLHRRPWFRSCFGPAGADLRSLAGWPLPTVQSLIIAGTHSHRRWPPLEKPNDGTVRLCETHLPGCTQRQLPVDHSFGMNHPSVIAAAQEFLAPP